MVRNGYAAPRTILTGVGPLKVTMPRVHDRRPAGPRERFTSQILPPYPRKAKTIDELIPWLDLKQRGLTADPKLAIADGALGFWAAMRKRWPTTREQRCWVHKTANVLDKLPKRLHGEAKDKIHQIWMAPTKQAAEEAFDLFVTTYQAKSPQAVACLEKDRDALRTFHDFPAQHWLRIRTTNPIESTSATVRPRHDKTKGNGSRKACLAMGLKLVQSAQKRWRRLNGHDRISDVIAGIVFINGEKQRTA